MNTMRTSVLATTTLLLSSCGGGSGGDSLLDSNSSSGSTYDSCTAPFYQTAIGTYIGSIEASQLNHDRTQPWHTCEWEVEINLRGITNQYSGICELKVDYRAKVTRSENYGNNTISVCVEIDQTFWTYSDFFADDDYVQNPTFPLDISMYPQTEIHPFPGLPDHSYMTPITGETAEPGDDIRLIENGVIEPIPLSTSVVLTSGIYKQ